jgi:hypothetical protein
MNRVNEEELAMSQLLFYLVMRCEVMVTCDDGRVGGYAKRIDGFTTANFRDFPLKCRIDGI